MFECLGDAVEKAKLDFQDPYIIIGGDLNRRDVSTAISDFSDIKIESSGEEVHKRI